MLEVQQVSTDLGHIVVTQGNAQVLQLGGAREGEEPDLLIELRTLDGFIVGLGDSVIDNEQGGARVGNGWVGIGGLLHLTGADLEGVGGHLPEPLTVVDGDGGQVTLDGTRVDGTEGVGALRTFP